MMPFSALRTWGLGLISWVIIGAGLYCIWEWADGMHPPLVERQEERDRSTGQVIRVQEHVIANADRQGGWPFLIGGLALLALSLGGSWPISLVLGKGGSDEPRSEGMGQEHWLERPDGSRLFLESYGPPTAPTLVLTHGWTLDSSAWCYVREELAKRFHIVVWDLPGLGKSRGPANGDYRIEKMADDLAAVVEQAGPGPIILVGHSIGGMITQTFCRLHSQQLGERVAGIVLLHTTYINPLRTAFIAPVWSAIEKPVVVPLNYLNIWLAPWAWLSNWQSYWNGSLHIMTRITSFAGSQTRGQIDHGAWLAAKAWPGVVARGNLAMLAFDEQATLPEIDIPALVIAGKHDILTKPSASAHLEASLPQAVLATVPTGHLGYWERHQEVSELIAAFTEKFSGRPAASSKTKDVRAVPFERR
jgi:pimeloyl-ACP methyl ester carboxylesterase